MFIPIGFIILFLFAPNLAILCGIVALAFMFPAIPIFIVLLILTLFTLGKFYDYIDEKINKNDNNIKTTPTWIKKILLWNVDPKTAKWHQVFLLITWWILLLIIFGVSLVLLAQI